MKISNMADRGCVISSVFPTVRSWFIYQFLPVLHRLEILLLSFLSSILLFQVGLDGFVLRIEVAHILVEIIQVGTHNRHHDLSHHHAPVFMNI